MMIFAPPNRRALYEKLERGHGFVLVGAAGTLVSLVAFAARIFVHA